MSDRPTVLVTGGGRRLGRAIATRFGTDGCHVVVHYGASYDEAEELVANLPSAETIQCDLRDREACDRMIDDVAARHERFAVLVNCASIFEADTHEALDPELLHRAIEVNALAPARLAQRFLAKSRARACRVIQVTDQKLKNTNPDFFSYTMSKHALDATIGMLAKGHTNTEHRIYGLAPGAILASHDQDEAEAERSHTLNLLRRRTTLADIADAARFLGEGVLASGQTLYVDSGQHLLSQPRDVIYLAREDDV